VTPARLLVRKMTGILLFTLGIAAGAAPKAAPAFQ
jgi:hypothetical protein